MRFLLGFLIYVVCGLFTFATVFEAWELPSQENRLEYKFSKTDRAGVSVIGGLVWPLYWGAKGALHVVRKVKAHPATGAVCNLSGFIEFQLKP